MNHVTGQRGYKKFYEAYNNFLKASCSFGIFEAALENVVNHSGGERTCMKVPVDSKRFQDF